MSDRAYTTTVTTDSTPLRVPVRPNEAVTWVFVTAVAAAWVAPWGSDAVAGGDNCIYFPAGRTRGFRYTQAINACAVSSTAQIIVETVVGESEDSVSRGDYPEAI